MSIVTEGLKPVKALPEPSVDFYELAETLPAEELATLEQVREFMQRKVAPVINKKSPGTWQTDSRRHSTGRSCISLSKVY